MLQASRSDNAMSTSSISSSISSSASSLFISQARSRVSPLHIRNQHHLPSTNSQHHINNNNNYNQSTQNHLPLQASSDSISSYKIKFIRYFFFILSVFIISFLFTLSFHYFDKWMPLTSSPPNPLTATVAPSVSSYIGTSSHDVTVVTCFMDIKLTENSQDQINTRAQRSLQYHSLLSFLHLTPYIILYVSDDNACTDAQAAIPNLQCYSYTPFLNESTPFPRIDLLLQHAHQHANTDLIFYVHHDIVLANSWPLYISKLVSSFSPEVAFIATAQRTDVTLPTSLEYEDYASSSRNYVQDIMTYAAAHGSVQNEYSIPILLYSKHWYASIDPPMPPFIFADYYWSNWFLSSALDSKNAVVIKVTAPFVAIHQRANGTFDRTTDNWKSIHQYNYRLVYRSETSSSQLHYFKIGHLSNAELILSGDCPSCVLSSSNSSLLVLAGKQAAVNNWLLVVVLQDDMPMEMISNWICWAERAGVPNYVLLSHSTSKHLYLHDRGFPVVFLSTAGDSPVVDNSDALADDVVEVLLSHGFSIIYFPITFVMVDSPFQYLSVSPFEVSFIQGYGGDSIVAMRTSQWSRYYWNNVISCHQSNSFIADHSARHDCLRKTYSSMKMVVKGGPLDPLLFAPVDSFLLKRESPSLGIYPYSIELPSKDLASLAGLFIFDRKKESCLPAEISLSHRTPHSANIQVTIRVLLASSNFMIVPLLQNLTNAIYEGENVNLEIAIDGLIDNPSPAEREQWQKFIDDCESFQWSHGNFLVTVQHKHVGTPYLLFATPDDRIANSYVVILQPPVIMSPIWYGYLKHVINFYHKTPRNYDPQLYGFSLAITDEILGETPIQYTTDTRVSQFLQPFSLNDPNSHLLFRYQLVTSAFVFFPDHFADLANWMKYMHDSYPTYLPCIPTLSTNKLTSEERHHNPTGHWKRWVHRLVFERGWYALHLNLPKRASLAINSASSAGFPPLLRTIPAPFIQFKALYTLPLYDFHFRNVGSAVSLKSRAHILNRSWLHQCTTINASDHVHDNIEDEYNAPNM